MHIADAGTPLEWKWRLHFFNVPRGLSSPELNFLKSAHGHSCPEVHHRVESIEFNWPILGQMAIFIRKHLVSWPQNETK